jgi:hypothetical protein
MGSCRHVWLAGGSAPGETTMNRTSRPRRTPAGSIVPIERVQQAILVLRGQRVIIDADLARLYGVTTKRLNEQVKRNPDRFPPDFMFQLSVREKAEVVANCDHLKNHKYSPQRPYAFTEHGAIMAANVLNSPKAVKVSVLVVRAFVRLRQLLATHADLARKLAELERKYDHQFKVVFDAIRQLMAEPDPPRKPPIGYLTEGGKGARSAGLPSPRSLKGRAVLRRR